jgi:hypothetical protein
MRLKDPERCRHLMARREFRPSNVLGEQVIVEACLDCGIEMLHPADSTRILSKGAEKKPARRQIQRKRPSPTRASSR